MSIVPIISSYKASSGVELKNPYLYYEKGTSILFKKHLITGDINLNEEQFVLELLKLGAIIQEHHVKIPRYKTWAKIKPGIKIVLKTSLYTLEYVPPTETIIPPELITTHPYIIKNIKTSLYVNTHIFGSYTISKKTFDNIQPHLYNFSDISEETNIPINDFVDIAYTKSISTKDLQSILKRQIKQQYVERYDNYVIPGYYETSDWDKAFDKAVLTLLLKNKRNLNFSFKEGKHLLKNSAPLSEQGKLKIFLKSEKKKEKTLEEMSKLGINSSSIMPEQNIGYVHQYQEKHEQIVLPKNFVILHGMTGVKKPSQALKRLSLMISQEGILSYAERRKRRLRTRSLSPIGDMVSGIDWAVPATINSIPTYGQYIYFVIKPQALTRKHIFFSDDDFGGGKNRFDAYNSYAQSLGQKNIFTPPTKEQKETHLKNIQKETWKRNEVWFDHSILWENIEYIIVEERIQNAVKQILQSNPKTQHIKIKSFLQGYKNDFRPTDEVKQHIQDIHYKQHGKKSL